MAPRWIQPTSPLTSNWQISIWKKVQERGKKNAVLRIRIHIFLGLLNPDPLVRGTDPDLSIIQQKL